MERYRVVRVDHIEDHWIDTVKINELVYRIGIWNDTDDGRIALFRKEDGEIIPLLEYEVKPEEPESSFKKASNL